MTFKYDIVYYVCYNDLNGSAELIAVQRQRGQCSLPVAPVAKTLIANERGAAGCSYQSHIGPHAAQHRCQRMQRRLPTYTQRTAVLWAGQQRSLPAPRSTHCTRPTPSLDNHGNCVGLWYVVAPPVDIQQSMLLPCVVWLVRDAVMQPALQQLALAPARRSSPAPTPADCRATATWSV